MTAKTQNTVAATVAVTIADEDELRRNPLQT